MTERCVVQAGMRTGETAARPCHVELEGLPLGKVHRGSALRRR